MVEAEGVEQHVLEVFTLPAQLPSVVANVVEAEDLSSSQKATTILPELLLVVNVEADDEFFMLLQL